jgi:hypothetical protein
MLHGSSIPEEGKRGRLIGESRKGRMRLNQPTCANVPHCMRMLIAMDELPRLIHLR